MCGYIKNRTIMTYPATIIHVSIDRSAADVYRFASNPENFPKWVEFVSSIKKDGDSWKAETSLGSIHIRFAPQNEFGVIDHQVALENGETVFNPMRVLPNNQGCEFIFTLYRMPGRLDKEFNEDAQSVTKDLHHLKEMMEGR
jgi:hypothetical protein